VFSVARQFQFPTHVGFTSTFNKNNEDHLCFGVPNVPVLVDKSSTTGVPHFDSSKRVSFLSTETNSFAREGWTNGNDANQST